MTKELKVVKYIRSKRRTGDLIRDETFRKLYDLFATTEFFTKYLGGNLNCFLAIELWLESLPVSLLSLEFSEYEIIEMLSEE